ncbi:HK97 family phage prohead protease [Tranquillimonas alkanivorans]|uniref:Prohead serine protease domain-containing protein n=1 Tax=Tranquillimonas alkanivorans TaxID=441119 RepID=A0A1I5L1K5_9RHOB|nr:HK97 family phage prohead protease [Tranquillimonas alkanivorans]SFO91032.1 prohead peptidase. Unknown type peptidase. MEROPS family U35 [Tranquillimonas alkanivorans]
MTLQKFENNLRLSSALDVEVKAGRDGQIEGYASTFGGGPDRHGDIVAKGAFRKSLAAHRAEGTAPAMLWSHAMEQPIGKWLELVEDDAGLFVKGQVNLKTERGREAWEHVAAGDVGAFSIGYITPDGGRTYLGEGKFQLSEVELVEVSLVTVPANPKARITAHKSLGSKSELVEVLRGAGLAKAAAKRIAAGGWSALNSNHDEKAAQLAARIERATAQLKGTYQ